MPVGSSHSERAYFEVMQDMNVLGRGKIFQLIKKFKWKLWIKSELCLIAIIGYRSWENYSTYERLWILVNDFLKLQSQNLHNLPNNKNHDHDSKVGDHKLTPQL